MTHLFYSIKKNIYPIFLIVSIFLLSLGELFGLNHVQHVDELIAIPSALLLIAHVCNKDKRQLLYPLLTLILLLIVGIISSLVNFENIGFTNMIIDAFIFMKPFIYLFMGIFIPSHCNIKNKWLISFSKLMIILMSITFLIQLITTGNTKFVFFAPTNFGGWVANWLILFTVIITLQYGKYNFIYCIMSSVLIYFTDSGLGLLGIFLCLYFLFISRKIKINIFLLAGFAIIALIISYDEIVGYLLNSEAPRNILFRYAFITAITYFPFGSGFATYGSVMSAQNYSYLYYLYGFDKIYGLAPNSGDNYLFDAYYPMIIGQFGVFGTILFLAFLIMIFYIIFKTIRSRHRNAAITLFLYFVIMLLGFNCGSGTSCAFLLVLGLIINKLIDAKKQELFTEEDSKKLLLNETTISSLK